MTVNIADLNYDVLKSLLIKLPDISSLECDLIIQVCTHKLSGLNSAEEVEEVYGMIAKRYLDKPSQFNNHVDNYKIIKHLNDELKIK